MNKYICNVCDYITVRKHNFNRHIFSAYHKKSCITENGNKDIIYKCLSCGIVFSKNSNYKRHNKKCVMKTSNILDNSNIIIVLSQKMSNEEPENEQKNNTTNNNNYECILCNYKSKNKSNYNKHLKTRIHKMNIGTNTNTNTNTNIDTTNIDTFKTEVVKTLMNQFSSILEENNRNMLAEQTKLIMETQNKVITNNNNDNRIKNNQFNMNVFLNETCKDAMNMSDFIENLHVSMEDMEKTGELGFAKGMSRIIMNNLNAIEVCKRPIHCSDAKRETLYVKNNGVWEKETEERTKIKEVIYKVSCLNERQLIKWRDLPRNKGYHLSDHHKNDEFMNLVIEINKMRDEEIDKVITTISKHVTIDKVKMSGYLN
jgi:hypothetical protein